MKNIAVAVRGLLPVWVLLAGLAGCAPKVGLQPVSLRRAPAVRFTDDAGFAGLPDALRQSLRYYRRLPDTAVFRYGDLAYTAREMEASTALLLRIVEEQRGEERLRAIRERFLAYESRNGEGRGFFTGYYEPELAGSLTPTKRHRVPLYGVPADLVAVDFGPYVDLGILPEEMRRRSIRGRLDGRRLVPYDDRERIADRNSLQGRAEPILWVDDAVDLFFLQVQGSGRVRLEDGSVVRVNYADQNGRPYVSIGKLLLERIPRDRMSLKALKEHLRSNPAEASKIMNANPSYTFFRRVEEGPLGNIEVPLTPGRSVAMDSRLIPRGGVVWIETILSREATGAAPAPLRRFAVVQDTGGAITGHGRVDVFWGAGEDAERVAGHMKQEGRVFLLVARKEYLAAGPVRP